jgi:ERCC4-type nuclease
VSGFEFPALRSLGDLAGHSPIIIVDSREQRPLQFTRFKTQTGTLLTGDYSVVGLIDQFSIERKSVSDLVGCCMGENRERFERELYKLRGFEFKRLLVVGSSGEIETQRYHSRISPKSVLGSLNAWQCRFDIPVVFEPTPISAAHRIEIWAWYFSREIVVSANALLSAAANVEEVPNGR